MKYLTKLLIAVFFVLTPLAAETELKDLPADLMKQVEVFLNAKTEEARSGMVRFSDTDLERITNEFKKAHTKRDQRLFWLTEELYRRNAERVSAERIHYLYYAVLAALGIILGFAALSYRAAAKKD